MAKQQQWHKGTTYVVTGPGGHRRNLKYVSRFKIEGDDYELIVFRFMKPKAKGR